MKSEIINKSIELVYERGISEFSVRKLAKYIGISTRPIYYYFKDLDALFNDVSLEVLAKVGEYVSTEYTENKFLNSGVGYVLFAKELPHYYSILFIKEFWKNQTLEENNIDELMKSKATERELEIYNIMKAYSQGLAFQANIVPANFDLETIINLQNGLYSKLVN